MEPAAPIATVQVPAPGARDVLERRLRVVEERIPRLQRELASWPDDQHTAAALLTARSEAADLRAMLAATAHQDAGDPTVVEIGDTVTIRRALDAAPERFTIVRGHEARFDDAWISAASPLASALIGRRRGDPIAVRAPDGVELYELIAIEREQVAR